MRIDSFDYELPEDRIAQEPCVRRDASRLLVLRRVGSPELELRSFAELGDLLDPGDLVVVNDARVLPARLWGQRASGGTVEILLLGPVRDPDEGKKRNPVRDEGAVEERPSSAGPGRPHWLAMVRPSRRVRAGDIITLLPPQEPVASASRATLEITGEIEGGRKVISFPEGCDVEALLDSAGSMPLPPYIKREPGDGRDQLDRRRYQTVFARRPGAIAAPTAGLHFTRELAGRLFDSGVEMAELTLDVGPGTFQPVRSERAEDHVMEAERYEVPAKTVAAIELAKARGSRVVAVGTTVVRALEHAALRSKGGNPAVGEGQADLYIFPGFEFLVVDAMITNFHLPRSTPLLMVAALVGRERLLAAYRVAIAEGLRFYSYGDAMLVL